MMMADSPVLGAGAFASSGLRGGGGAVGGSGKAARPMAIPPRMVYTEIMNPPGAAVRVPLQTNPASIRTGMQAILPWLVTMTIAGFVRWGLDRTGRYDSMAGQAEAGRIVMVILFVGLVATIILRFYRPRAIELSFEGDTIRVIKASSGGLLASAPLASVKVTRGIWNYASRAGSYDYPALALDVPGYRSVTLCVWDSNMLWKGDAADARKPRYVVAEADWARLVELLEVA